MLRESTTLPGVQGWGGYDSQEAFEKEVHDIAMFLKTNGNGTKNLHLQLKENEDE